MKKRILSILLCICIVMSVLPMTAMAAGPAVTIGSTTLTSGKYYTISGDALTELDSAPVSGGYLYYTLDGANATLTVTGDVSYSADIPALSITDSTLSLTGSGNLTMTSSSTPAVSGTSGSLTTSGYTGDISLNSTGSNAITNCTDVTLETSGTLTISGNSSNATIYCGNNITLKGSTVSLTNGSNSQLVCAFGESVSISATNGDLNLTGSTPLSPLIIADSGEQGINGTVTLSASGNISVTNSGSGMTIGCALTVSKAQNVTITSAGSNSTICGATDITADGDVNISNTCSGMAVSNNLTATSKNGSVTVEGKHPFAPAISGTATITAAKNITITSVSTIDISNTATLSAVSGMVIRTTSACTTITKDGTPISASYGGDISTSGLNISGNDANGNADSAYNAPATKTLYKAGNGYAIFTPATADPAVNAKLELNNAVISTTSSALALPSTESVDITVTGDNSLTAGNGRYAITVNSQPLNVTGDGNLTLTSKYYGINVNGSGAVIDIGGDLTFDTYLDPISTSNGDITVSAKSIMSTSGYFFYGNDVSLTAKDGDIVLNETGKSDISYKILAYGDIVLNAPKGKIDITQSKGDYALKSDSGTVTLTALNDVTINAASQSPGISASSGSVSVTSKNGSINMDCNSQQCILAGGTVALTAAKDITLNNSADSSTAISAFSQAVDINAGGKLSSTSDYGFIVRTLTVKADEVSIAGTGQNGIQAVNSVTITNPNGGNCKNVNIVATSSYDFCAAISSADITLKSDNLFICGNKSAKAINATGTVTIDDAGIIVGTITAVTDNIAAGIVRGQNGGDISTSSLDLSTPPTDSTVYTAVSGYALYRPASGETPATLTLHNASIETNTNIYTLILGAGTVLQLEGTNSITNSNPNGQTAGITTSDGFSPVTIQGGSSDTLTVSAWCCTYVGDLTVSGSTVSMYSSVYGMVTAGNVILKNGAQVSVTGGDTGYALQVDSGSDLTVDGDSTLTVNGPASITGNMTVSGGSTVTADTNQFYVDGNTNITGSGSKLTVNSGSSLEAGGTVTVGSDAALVNNGIVDMKPGTTVEQIKAVKLTGLGVLRVVTATDPQYGFPTAWDSYNNEGVAVTELSGGLDLTSGEHSTKTLDKDGYTFSNNTLTLGDNTYISGGVTLPDDATVITNTNSTINGSISLASLDACDLTFSGTGNLTVVGNIGNAQGGTMTVSCGVNMNVNGSVNIGTSGGADGTLNVTGAGTTLSASSSQGYAVFFKTVNVGSGASLIAKAEGNGSIGVEALSGGVNVTDGSTLTTGCDYGVYIFDGKLNVDDSSKLITNGAVAPFCIVDTSSAKPQDQILYLSGKPVGTEIDFIKGTNDFTGNGKYYTYWSLAKTVGSLKVSDENHTPATLKGAVQGEKLEFSKIYNVTVQNDGNGTASANLTTASQGTEITLTATPNSNYKFKEWQVISGGMTITNNKFTMPNGNVTVKAVFEPISNNGGGNSGGYNPGSGTNPSGDNTSDNTKPADKPSDMPTVVKQSVSGTVNDGILTLHITEIMAKDAIKAAQDLAKKSANTANGIAVEFAADNATGYHSLVINIDEEAVDLFKEAAVKYIKIDSAIFGITLDTQTITEIDKQSSGMVTVSAMKQTKLSDAAKKLIDNRPVFDITAKYQKNSKTEYITDFGKGMVTLSICYKATANENTAGLFGFYIDKSGKPYLLSNSIYSDGKVIFGRNTLSTYGVGYKASTPEYTDTVKHWAKDNIDFVASRDLISGTSATTFAPNTAITRATYLMALGKLSGADVSSYKTSSFSDVKNTDPAMPYIEWAVKNKIVQGIGNGKFGPEKQISRQDMAVMMLNYAKATGYKLPTSIKAITFADNAKISAYAKAAVTAIQQAGVMSGKGNNAFDPKGNATRAEASTILRQSVKLVIDEGIARGWSQNDSCEWQFINKNGKAVTGWYTDENGMYQYYFTKDGTMVSGKWLEIDGKWYYFNTDGSLAKNTKIDGYEVDENGVRKTNKTQ